MDLKSKEITNAIDVKGHGSRFCFLLTGKSLCSQLNTEIRIFLGFSFNNGIAHQSDEDRSYPMISPNFCFQERLYLHWKFAADGEVLAADRNCLFCMQGDSLSIVISVENTRKRSLTHRLSPSFMKDSVLPPELSEGITRSF